MIPEPSPLKSFKQGLPTIESSYPYELPEHTAAVIHNTHTIHQEPIRNYNDRENEAKNNFMLKNKIHKHFCID